MAKFLENCDFKFKYRATVWKMKFTHLTNKSSYNDKVTHKITATQWHLEYLEYVEEPEQNKTNNSNIFALFTIVNTAHQKNIQHELAIVRRNSSRFEITLLKVLLFWYDTWIYYYIFKRHCYLYYLLSTVYHCVTMFDNFQ